MAAPTPVSSLVHSSTLVTAGVYILIRFNYFLTGNLKFFLMLISLFTMVIAGVSGVFEYDLKKIIALSTLSQLGFIIMTICIGFSNLAFFHLITHASFKALLFICAGIFIHYFFDNQDIRYFGLINKNFSFSFSIFTVANFSLCGFPFLSGFFSKDLILEIFLLNKINLIFFFLAFLGTFLTVFYTFRLIFFLSFKNLFFCSSEVSNKKIGIEFSIIFLFFFSIFLGFFGSTYFFFPYNYVVLPFTLKLSILVLCLFSFLFVFIVSKTFYIKNNTFIKFFSQIWFLHFFKRDFLKRAGFCFSFYSTKVINGVLELFIGFYLYNFIFKFSSFLRNFLKTFFSYFFVLFMFFVIYNLLINF